MGWWPASLNSCRIRKACDRRTRGAPLAGRCSPPGRPPAPSMPGGMWGVSRCHGRNAVSTRRAAARRLSARLLSLSRRAGAIRPAQAWPAVAMTSRAYRPSASMKRNTCLGPGSVSFPGAQLCDRVPVVLHQLVDGVSRRRIGRDADPRPDSEAVDRSVRIDQFAYSELVEPPAGEYTGPGSAPRRRAWPALLSDSSRRSPLSRRTASSARP